MQNKDRNQQKCRDHGMGHEGVYGTGVGSSEPTMGGSRGPALS